MSLPDRPRAVITGAGSGLGRALALQLARRHARLVLCDIDEPSLHETAGLARAAGADDVTAARCDVSDAAQVAALAEASEGSLGAVDLLVNNAGVAVAGEVGEIPLDDWRWIVGINLWGVIHGCHAFLPRMREAKRGHVLNVASAAGLLAGPKMAPYNVTKAAVVALSETLRADLAADGVGVSVLCPTFFPTNIGARARGGDPGLRAAVAVLLQSGKLSADDVAGLALEGVERGDLYITPHADGRWLWRLKRATPERFYDVLPRFTAWHLARVMKRAAKDVRG